MFSGTTTNAILCFAPTTLLQPPHQMTPICKLTRSKVLKQLTPLFRFWTVSLRKKPRLQIMKIRKMHGTEDIHLLLTSHMDFSTVSWLVEIV
jgi:hypothetical protein